MINNFDKNLSLGLITGQDYRDITTMILIFAVFTVFRYMMYVLKEWLIYHQTMYKCYNNTTGSLSE